MTALAQTKPQDAISNISGWLNLIGVNDAPSFLTAKSTDLIFTLAGVTMMLIAGFIWFRRKKRKTVQPSPETQKTWVDAVKNLPAIANEAPIMKTLRRDTLAANLAKLNDDLAEESRPAESHDSRQERYDLARRIAAAPATSEFDFPDLVAILRAEIERKSGMKSAEAGKPPHSVDVLMRISNVHNRPMDNCRVQLISIGHHGIHETSGQFFRFGTATEFQANPKQAHNFYFVKRDMRDPITPHPFVLLLSNRDMPLHENTDYQLSLRLMSPYPIPSIVELELKTGKGVEISCEITRQYLEGYE